MLVGMQHGAASNDCIDSQKEAEMKTKKQQAKSSNFGKMLGDANRPVSWWDRLPLQLRDELLEAYRQNPLNVICMGIAILAGTAGLFFALGYFFPTIDPARY